ncbi:MAG: nitroreductase family deazaflavin-dependent oxidoreductase [Chloroflexi bacterium]|nr:nitroreductase family deazaflavin-dependent oxidoreductase [Chloroflexota bacterium]
MMQSNAPLTAYRRLLDRFWQTRLGSWIISHVAVHLDPLIMRATAGRLSSVSLFGHKVLILTTIGAKSGQRRESTLLYVTDQERLILIASNFGGPRNPAWYHNLKANPEAEILLHRYSGRYEAREAEGAERDKLWTMACETYSGYERYRERSHPRKIPVMILEPLAQK